MEREGWGDRRDSNPQQPEPQSGALPLSYGHHHRARTLEMRLPSVKSGFWVIHWAVHPDIPPEEMGLGWGCPHRPEKGFGTATRRSPPRSIRGQDRGDPPKPPPPPHHPVRDFEREGFRGAGLSGGLEPAFLPDCSFTCFMKACTASPTGRCGFQPSATVRCGRSPVNDR